MGASCFNLSAQRTINEQQKTDLKINDYSLVGITKDEFLSQHDLKQMENKKKPYQDNDINTESEDNCKFEEGSDGFANELPILLIQVAKEKYLAENQQEPIQEEFTPLNTEQLNENKLQTQEEGCSLCPRSILKHTLSRNNLGENNQKRIEKKVTFKFETSYPKKPYKINQLKRIQK